jgi:hypothetical protein
MILLEILASYTLAGAVIAVAFLIFGMSRTLPHVSVTLGARLLLLPGAILFWPLFLGRWLKPHGNR